MQRVNFPYELVIGEDSSTDNTRELLLRLQEKNPGTINLLLSEKNLGMQRNFVRAFKACRGHYIALLDGDDYWISPHKLQKQVDFLDSHPECAICFHNVNIVNQDGTEVLREAKWQDQKEITSIVDLVQHNFTTTCSVMFRNGLITQFPSWFYSLPMIDWQLLILNAIYGDIGFIDEILAAYRKNPNGVWTKLSVSQVIQNRLLGYQVINSYLNYKYQTIIQPIVDKLWKQLEIITVDEGVQVGMNKEGINEVPKIFNGWPANLVIPNRWKTNVFCKIYERLLFAGYANQELEKAKYCWLELIRYNPLSLSNRGVIAIGMEVFLGRRVADQFRWLTRRLFRK